MLVSRPCLCTVGSLSAGAEHLFFEDFNSLTLGPLVDEIAPAEPRFDLEAAWTPNPPTGWMIDNSQMAGPEPDIQDFVWSSEGPTGWSTDNSQMPEGGVEEWRGWNYADAQWWATVAGEQGRENMAFGFGTVLVADPDEWEDDPHDEGAFNSFVSSPPIDISGVPADSLSTSFISSWRSIWDPPLSMVGTLSVSFDGGDPVELFRWDGDPESPNFREDDFMPPGLADVDINNPAGASTMTLTWGMTEAGNDWWWAIDEIEVVNTSNFNVIYFEDFEFVELGQNVDEGIPNEANLGSTEFRGFTFQDAGFWEQIAGGQDRDAFTLGDGVVALPTPMSGMMSVVPQNRTTSIHL